MASVTLYDGEITMHNHGINIKRSYASRPSDYAQKCFGDKQGKHGGIITFSATSSRNLKRKLLDLPYSGQGVALYGVTLTIQADAYAAVPDPVEEVRKHWRSFTDRISQEIKAGAFDSRFMFIWRIELTQKGTPHWHCIVCTPRPSDVLLFQATWCRLVGKWYGYAPNMDIAAQYRRIDNCAAAFAYVGAHAAKHKRDQLGWKGRQWGVICPTKEAKEFYALKTVAQQKGPFCYHSIAKLRRLIRRIYTASLRSNGLHGVRGRRLAFRRASSAVHFLARDTLEQIERLLPFFVASSRPARSSAFSDLAFEFGYVSQSDLFNFSSKKGA